MANKPKPPKIKRRITSFQIIILGFIGVILLGALILMLPISSKSGNVTPFNQTLFTSTSAVCVTGLIVQDTATYWSSFGQAVILIMIQIGGLGVITIAASFALLTLLKLTALIELTGALVMMPVFVHDHGARGIWMAFFHSISAFCNAGFDIMGTPDNKFASLTEYRANPVIGVTVMLLIIIGGIGFLVWDDIVKNKLRFKKYRMQTKVVLVTSGLLILIPAIVFFFTDLR